MKTMFMLTDWKAWLEIIILFFSLLILSLPLGRYLAKVYQGEAVWFDKIARPVEKAIYKISKINPIEQMTWQEYAKSVLALGIVSFFALYLLLRFQAYLPLNPQHYLAIQHDMAFNIAISFLTNTNWQSYEGEKVLSYFSQMVGLGVQNFISAGTGMAVAVALIRGITRTGESSLGNFWVDITKSIIYILLPLAIIMAILLGSQGVIQNFNEYLSVPVLDSTSAMQTIPGGPVASQVAIKQLGTNGGGFFGANSAYPFENPSPFSNFLQLMAILLIPVSFIIAYGEMIKDTKQSNALLGLLLTIFVLAFSFCVYHEFSDSIMPFEGKEYRNGILSSILWTVSTTATANGSTNSLIEFFVPLVKMVPLFFMLTGEVVFGGVGQGLYTLILYIFITIFMAGLMAGRMPEYLGKKIEVYEIKMTMLAILIPVLTVLLFFVIATQIPDIKRQLSYQGAKGFTELLYGFASTTANNGSALTGLMANTSALNIIFGVTMLLGRYGLILPVLAIAGNLARKTTALEKDQSFARSSMVSTSSLIFMILLFNVILIISLLSFMPVILMGPIAEYLLGVKMG